MCNELDEYGDCVVWCGFGWVYGVGVLEVWLEGSVVWVVCVCVLGGLFVCVWGRGVCVVCVVCVCVVCVCCGCVCGGWCVWVGVVCVLGGWWVGCCLGLLWFVVMLCCGLSYRLWVRYRDSRLLTIA